MNNCQSELIRQLRPSVTGEQPGLEFTVKLNANESPFAPSPRVLSAMREACGEDLRLYPDANADALCVAIARRFALTREQVFVGNGSNEVLAHAFCALFGGGPVLFPDVSYGSYRAYCSLFRLQAEPVPLDEQFCLRIADYRQSNGGIIFPNPNVPTGILLPLTEVEALLNAEPESVVIVDESYIDFGGESAVVLIDHFPNLLVTQTLSKSHALAGLRVGFAMGQRHLIDALLRVKDSFNPYTLNRVAQRGAEAAIEDEAYRHEICAKVCRNRQALVEGLSARGFLVLPSSANFVFARHPQQDAEALARGLRERAVIVRHFKQARIDQFLRISVGSDQQQQVLFDALDALVG